MALIAPTTEEFSIWTVQIPPAPSYPVASTHEIRLRGSSPKSPTVTDSRSLFLKNVPADSTEAHFRALFGRLIGAGRFESILFEDQPRQSAVIDPEQAIKLEALSKKRKRERDGEEDKAELSWQEEVTHLPELWNRRPKRSGSSAVVLLVDQKCVQLVLKAVSKLETTKKYPVWGEGLPEDTPPLGASWISDHLRACRCDESLTQAAVHAFFEVFNRKEKVAAELARRLRNEPDEDGFVMVTRAGGRGSATSQFEAEEARRRMQEKEAKKQSETTDFYRFQHREKRQEEQAALVRSFKEDAEKVRAMRNKRHMILPDH